MSDIPEFVVGHFCDLEQYERLRRCSENRDMTEWNEWRKANPDEEIRLQGADFSGAYLSGVNLTGAQQCQGANFEGAQCQGADFTEAQCQGAFFQNAKCYKANFKKANLIGAQCQGANFEGAQCQGANFEGAQCQGANFEGAGCHEALFQNAKCQDANFGWAECQKAKFMAAECRGANFIKAQCNGADFRHAECQDVFFNDAQCQDADFTEAECHGAFFKKTQCQKAKFFRAHCEDVDFSEAHCEGADFEQAWFSSSTVFFDCIIDDATDFTSTDLGSIRVEPGKRARMEYNVRRLTWEKRYREQTRFIEQGLQLKGLQKLRTLLTCLWALPCLSPVKSLWHAKGLQKLRTLLTCLRALPCLSPVKSLWHAKGLQKPSTMLRRLCAWLYLSPVRFFWYVSDYGYSTGRVIAWFAFFILLFTSLYTFCPWMLMINNAVVEAPLFERSLQMLTFATSTMVTLGFSNINVAIEENGRPVLIGMFVVSCNLIVGYFMLAVLVTRLGILFQSLGPGEPRIKIRRARGEEDKLEEEGA